MHHNFTAPDVVLTAAHCIDDASLARVLAGAHDRSLNEPGQQELKATRFIIHPDWNAFTVNCDIGLIFLDQEFEMTETVGVASRAAVAAVAGDMLTATGWGKTCDYGVRYSSFITGNVKIVKVTL